MFGIPGGPGDSMGPPTLSLQEALNSWIDYRSRFWSSEGTRYDYALKVRGWIEFLGASTSIENISRVTIQKLFLHRDNGLRSGSWLNEERKSLSSFFKWAVDLGLIAENPVTRAAWPSFDPEKKRSDRSRVKMRFTPRLLDQVLDLSPLRYHRILPFISITGIRVSEALRARVRWLEPDPRNPACWIMRIPGGDRKMRRGSLVILSAHAISILGRAIHGDPGDLLFPEAPKASAIRKNFEKVGKILGIRHLGCHQLRRTYSTDLLNAGVPLPAVCNQLGWTSAPREVLELVRNHYYLGADGDQIRRVTDRLRDQ